MSLKDDFQEATGLLQQNFKMELSKVAMHAINTIFEDNKTEAVIPVEASNTFNSLNHLVALHIIQV